MAKELIVAVMEEVVGEYILNISKENIKIAALRGKLKLENVQLDGDLIGSHVLGAVGLSGFGILSCWARSLKVVVPLKNLEKEPTRVEMCGLHLLCVPLLPSTANREYGAGTSVDPRCTLRTRAKRSALARLQRNYFSGRIPGEGPPSRRMRRALVEAERVLRKGKGRWKGSFNSGDEDTLDTDTREDTDVGSELEDESGYSDSEDQLPQVDNIPAAIRIPIVANNWKTKLREKMLRNMEVKIEDLHIRCEISEQGLDFSQPEDQREKPRGDFPAEQRAFSFGVALDSIYVRTANDKWEVGSETAKSADESSSRTSRQDDESTSSLLSAATGSTQSAGVTKNKILEINNASIYWDDDPPLLISETYLLRSNDHNISPVRLQSRVGAAMDAMRSNQDPGNDVRKSLSVPGATSPNRTGLKRSQKDNTFPHHYILEDYSWKAQVKMGDRNQPGPMTLVAEFLPATLDLYFRPHQYMQYCMLRSAMLSQQRFDTMLRQRPMEDPVSNPLAWWKYAISCVTTRPNSRPWVDVRQIVRSRDRYMELVVENVLNSSGGNGFHGGLNDVESSELLALEELLPIEALMSFHLLALRKVYKEQLKNETEDGSKSKRGRKSLTSPEKIQTKPRFRRFRKALGGVGSKTNLTAESASDDSETDLLPSVLLTDVQPSDSISRASLKEAISVRLGQKTWHNTFFLNDANLKIHLLDPTDNSTTLRLDLRMSGKARRLGPAKLDLSFDVMRFEVVDCRHQAASSTPSHFFADGKILKVGEPRMDVLFSSNIQNVSRRKGLMPRSPTVVVPGDGEADKAKASEHKDLALPSYLDLPPGVVCRLGSSKEVGALKLNISAHPVTLVWHKSSIDALSEFFASSTSQLQTELTRQLQNVATPLARKAQLALLSPDAITVDVNMAAPKIWMPVSSESNDALFLDAGRFRVACAKKEQGTDTHWEVIARDIQVMFVRMRRSVSRAGKTAARDFSVTGVPDSEELPIIRPFHIHLNDSLLENVPTDVDIRNDAGLIGKGPLRKTTVTVSPIRLNLVDAEVLARAIGKWYAQGIVRVKGRARSETDKTKSAVRPKSPTVYRAEEASPRASDLASPKALPSISSSHTLLVTIEKVEMAVEGHSKSSVQISDDQSVTSYASLDTFMDPTPRKRTYLVEIFDIVVDRTKNASKSQTMLTVQDASIARLKENTSPFPTFVPQESQYLILVRADGRQAVATQGKEVSESVFQPILESPLQDGDKNGSISAPALAATSPAGFAGSSPLGASTPADASSLSPPIGISGASPHDDRLQLSPGNYSTSPRQTVKTAAGNCILNASLFHDAAHHIDEVEIDIDSIIVRVTPTSLKDSAKGLRRFLELVELATKEMERKVHEEGRNARRMERLERSNRDLLSSRSSVDRGISQTDSEFGTEVANGGEAIAAETMIDSSILFKVTLRESIMLIGRPVVASGKGVPIMDLNAKKRETPRSNAVVQVLSKSLIMFQSIENPDGSGSKTLHTSLDNFSIALNTDFEPVSLSEVPPTIGPTASEIRVVYATENLGCVVSQDVSLTCESVKACLAPEDMKILATISRYVLERLRTFGVQNWFGGDQNTSDHNGEQFEKNVPSLGSLIRYQKKGTGIATRLRIEVQLISFVLLRTFRQNIGVIPIFDLNVKALKGNVEGCMSALSGEIAALVSANFFNTELGDWEFAVEPFQMVLAIDQMPNELILNLSTGDDTVQLNLTSMLLKDIAEMDFNLLKNEHDSQSGEDADRLLAALENVGRRRAADSCSVKLRNESGLDFFVYPSDSGETSTDQKLVGSGSHVFLESFFGVNEIQKLADLGSQAIPTLAVSLAPSSTVVVGDRRPILNLPAVAASTSVSLHRLIPVSSPDSIKMESSSPVPPPRKSGRGSPDTMVSGISMAQNSTFVYYNAEPVVEWCMQNQRLRSSVNDVYNLDSGRDILNGSTWSPDDEKYYDPETWHDQFLDESHLSRSSEEEEQVKSPVSGSLLHPRTSTKSHLAHMGNWVRPYLKNDSPEWTDMTCVLRMARERVMLPDSNWIWLDDWTVDLSGAYGEETDADGWEYEADFETFKKARRSYARGDACRRRRWTRTRIVRPPRVDDPYRQLSIVWETLRDEHGNFTITLKSNLVLHNTTSSCLSFFAYSPSWEDDKFLGEVSPGEKLFVPVQFACATNLRIGQRCRRSGDTPAINDFAVSPRVMIVPTSYTSSSLVRTSIEMNNAAFETAPTSGELHYLIRVECEKGVVDVFVEPVLRIINLLPCELQCELGELSKHSRSKGVESNRKVIGSKGKRIVRRESITMPSGEEAKYTAVNPASKPFISLRVPGYQWSPWQRVVNRKADSHTWRPSRSEEEVHLRSDRGDVDFVEEFKSIVLFERIGKAGDPLVLVISVEVGHCPTIRVYAQYWILDKTGFGCRFCDGFADILGSIPDNETSRRSHLLPEEAKDPEMKRDMSIPGHQWPIGMNGMSLFFSSKEKFSMCIESGVAEKKTKRGKSVLKSKWVSPMDVSIVMPKTVFSVDEQGGPRRFDLAMSVAVCPGIYARTKLITLFPRYQIVNLLKRQLVVAQDGCLDPATVIPSQSSVPVHRERQSLPPRMRLGVPGSKEVKKKDYEKCWSNGCIQLDKIGITSLRLPEEASLSAQPMVIQAEVRLATKEQACAVVVVIWSTNEKSNPLYLLRNLSSRTIICRQPLQDEGENKKDAAADALLPIEACTGEGSPVKRWDATHNPVFECGAEIGPIVRHFLGLDRIDEFVWILRERKVACFGFDDPEKPHILEWTFVNEDDPVFDKQGEKGVVEVDAMGSTSTLMLADGTEVMCHIIAEHSTKVIEFFEPNMMKAKTFGRSVSSGLRKMRDRGQRLEALIGSGKGASDRNKLEQDENEEEEEAAFSFKLDVPSLTVGVVDNAAPGISGREILLAIFDRFVFDFSQNREGYHEFELTLMTMQVDNHVYQAVHPVLLFCPPPADSEPLLHMSAVRRLQPHSSTFVFRYAAVRLLEVEILLDRRIVETVARFIDPLVTAREVNSGDPTGWVNSVTIEMSKKFSNPDRRAPRDVEQMILTANSGRIYFEQLHLHPVRVTLTFTQEWMEWNDPGTGGMIFQFIRGMASIANAPLTFTSFVVAHVFESPQALYRIVSTHYSSQLTKQIFAIIGSLAILGAPADFISNVGTGVRDFFYEPINGMVHGPAQFLEGLEVGTQSLARGVFVGVVRGAASVTDLVNSNLAAVTADDAFIDERKAHQRMLTDAMSRGETSRTMTDSLYLAGASVARSVKSGAVGIVEQPTMYASRHGPVGFVKGVGKAIVGAVVKPVVGVGDGAVLLMNHVSEATSDKQVLPKIPKRLRRALPRVSSDKPHCVKLVPYDDRAAKAQKIVTGGESVDDVYIGHVNIPGHLIISSEHCLWAIDRKTREPWCVRWEEISHFGMLDGSTMRITVFSQTGLKSYIFPVDNAIEFAGFHRLLEMQLSKMGNGNSNANVLHSSLFSAGLENLSQFDIPGVKKRQKNYVFGSCNNTRPRLDSTIKDEIDVIEQCFGRVKVMGSESSKFFQKLDEEAWTLVHSWGQVFSGLSSRRCIAASIINGTGNPIQIMSHKLVEGGSPCYSIPTKEYDPEQAILHPGGAIIFFAWGVVPNLLQAGNVIVNIETNAFVSELTVHKTGRSYAEAKPGYQVGFLEKSHDEATWWAKYWLLVRSRE